ncbi:type VII secretion system-associated protein [Streptomyces sp. NPDC017979]|uniref:type VII secretion system-associated protein n=1 Tax=Streptomyces sp. NPDC017979 TaxID=3365024 RepID=UPI0037B765BE
MNDTPSAAGAGPVDGPASPAPLDPARTANGTAGPTGPVPRGHPAFHEPPEEYVSAARLAPGHWLSLIDRHWEGDVGEPPPRWAVPGRWRSDARGEIVEWEENPGYRPSPDAYGWAPPVDPADAAVRLVATGYASEDLLALAIADGEVAVCVDAAGAPAVTEAPGGTPAVPVFSPVPGPDADRLPPHRVMPVPALLDRLPEERGVLFLSSSAPVARLLSADELRAALVELLDTGGEIERDL